MKNFKKSVFLVMSCFILNSLSNIVLAEETSYPYIGIVTSEKLRVMPRKGTNYREISTLNQNDLVTVLDKNGDWLLVKPPENIPCWISGDFVVDGIVTGNSVNVRQGPGVSFPVLTQVNKGDKLNVINEDNTWKQISPPESLKAWVSAEFVNYFSNMNNLTSQLNRMEESQQAFNSAKLYATAELKGDPRAIDFDEIKDNYVQIIKKYSDTIYATKALFELKVLKEEQERLEKEMLENERQKRVKELFDYADTFASRELEKRNASDIDISTISINYITVIKDFPDKEEAKWSIERLSSIRKKIEEASMANERKRLVQFNEAEDFRRSELLKDVSEIDYEAILTKYRSITLLYPGTTEARKAATRLEDIERRQSYAKFKTGDKKSIVSSLYSYEGILVKEDVTQKGTLYRLEERGFLHKKDLCTFYSNDKDLESYANRKVKIQGILVSFDENDRPILDLKRIQLQ